jgi:hypothetical protein
MRKLKLHLETLRVDSFATAAPVEATGTVRALGLAAQTYPECPSPLCVDTPLASCDGSCQPGCGGAEPVEPAPAEPVGVDRAGA